MLLQLICHILHIAATCTSLGGLFYARMVLVPNLQYVPESARELYLSKMIKRYGYIKWIGVTVIIITGIIQLFDIYPQVADKRNYLLAFGIKMIGAVFLFTITFLLAFPADRLKGMQRNRKFWAGINVLCALALLTGASFMRAVRNGQL
ncbi:MAG: hypothetical protein H7257_13345 [Taibaiella sp.]|nr:hypothetical protein [Taibaiella sp.]